MLRSAQAENPTLWIGLDPVAATMAKSSSQALRARGRTAVFALGAVESLPDELFGLASRVTVNLPWGSLLRAVAAPDGALLSNIAAICRPEACLEVVYSASPRDANELKRLGVLDADPTERLEQMRCEYAAAGFQLEHVRPMHSDDLRDLGTTWAKKLWRDPERRAWRLTARRD